MLDYNFHVCWLQISPSKVSLVWVFWILVPQLVVLQMEFHWNCRILHHLGIWKLEFNTILVTTYLGRPHSKKSQGNTYCLELNIMKIVTYFWTEPRTDPNGVSIITAELLKIPKVITVKIMLWNFILFWLCLSTNTLSVCNDP